MPHTPIAHISAKETDYATLVADAVDADGCAVLTDVIAREDCAPIVEEIQRIEVERSTPFGKNDFEGFHTRRIFNLIACAPRIRELVIHPTLLAATEAILGDGFLLSGTTSMHLFPGETPQLLHADDGMISLPRPHPATLVTTLWALSDFSETNGGTHVVPGSHRAKDMPKPGDLHEHVAVSMPAGSVLFLHGSTWHGGGENSTQDEERFGVSIQFVAGWCRQQQNLMLGTPREVVATYPRRLQELIGYSIYRNVMGHVDRQHPLTLLGVEQAPDMVWEKMDRKPGAAD